ncbi:diacylglycerol kinase family protein [Roseomonas mucosa]
MSGAGRIGLITNPRSRALREGRFPLAEAAAGLPSAAPATPAELRAALADFAGRGVDLLAVQGGDGTLREVLSALPQTFGATPPAIALLATGKTNLAARVVGAPGPGEEGLAALRRAAASGTLRHHRLPVLEVHRPGLDEAPMRGLLFGAGAFTAAKTMADKGLHGRGIHDRLAVFLALAGTALRSIVQRDHALRAGSPMALSVDGRPNPEGRRFLVLATPLDRLMLGFWPFSGEGAGPLHWLDVAAPPRRLAAAVWAARQGRQRPWMPAAGYASGRAGRLALRLDTPFVLDGEVFEPGPQGLVLTAPATATFAMP